MAFTEHIEAQLVGPSIPLLKEAIERQRICKCDAFTECWFSLWDALHREAATLSSQGLPILAAIGKTPCNGRGKPRKAWNMARGDYREFEAGIAGAFQMNAWRALQNASPRLPGLALRMGSGSCVDLETDSDSECRALAHLFRGVAMPDTVTYASRRGRHYLFRYDGRLGVLGGTHKYYDASGNSFVARIGARSSCISILPPSPDRRYLPGRSFHDMAPADLPDQVISRLLDSAGDRARKPERREKSFSIATIIPMGRGEVACGFSEIAWAKIDIASERTTIRECGTRHKRLFDFVRQLLAIPELRQINAEQFFESQTGSQFVDQVVWQWFERNRAMMTADFKECRADFVEAWDQVHTPWGASLAEAYEASQWLELSPHDLRLLGEGHTPVHQQVLRLCKELQRRAGDGPFFLDQRAAAAVLQPETSRSTIQRALTRLKDCGAIVRTNPDERRKVGRYCYPGGAIDCESLEYPVHKAA